MTKNRGKENKEDIIEKVIGSKRYSWKREIILTIKPQLNK